MTEDTHVPEGHRLKEQRLDETEVGKGTPVTLIVASRPADWAKTTNPNDDAEWLGFDPCSSGCVGWDVLDAVLKPSDLILLVSWHGQAAAEAFERTLDLKEGARLRRVRVVRDYGMFDRREALQFYPDATGRETIRD